MNYAEIKKYDIANGPGIRVSLFVSGCTHHCKGCFNQVTWDFNYGTPFTEETIDTIINYFDFPSYAGMTFLGGEPMEHSNQIGLLPLARRFKEQHPEKTLWCYSGYLFDKDIMGRMYNEWPETKELLSYIDVIVDGQFVEDLKDLGLRFRGSSNQRIIDVQKSIRTGETILFDFDC